MVPSRKLNTEKKLQIFCLGTFRIIKPGGSELIGVNRNQKIWSIFKYLAVHRGNPVPTQKIIEIFWGEKEDYTITAPLRTAICRLKTYLRPLKCLDTKGEYLIYNKDYCSFNTNVPYWLDIEEFENYCRLAWEKSHFDKRAAIELFCQAFELYQGDFLSEDLYTEWMYPFQEYYHKMYVEAVQDTAQWLIECQDYRWAVSILKYAIKIDPYYENLHTLLIKCFIGLSDYISAVQHYTECTGALYKELGFSPSVELRSLYKLASGKIERFQTCFSSLDQLDTYYTNRPLNFDPNFFGDLIQAERFRMSRYGGKACLLILEICREARINSESIEEPCRHCLRKSDIICRLDEKRIGILLPMTDFEGGQLVWGHIYNELEQYYDIKLVIRKKIMKLTPLKDDHEPLLCTI